MLSLQQCLSYLYHKPELGSLNCLYSFKTAYNFFIFFVEYLVVLYIFVTFLCIFTIPKMDRGEGYIATCAAGSIIQPERLSSLLAHSSFTCTSWQIFLILTFMCQYCAVQNLGVVIFMGMSILMILPMSTSLAGFHLVELVNELSKLMAKTLLMMIQ